MINRINLILRAKNITARQFAEEIGIQPSGMSHILSGRNNPSLDFVTKVIRRYPEIDANWLLLGRGEMYASQSASQQPVSPVEMVHPTVDQSVAPNPEPTLFGHEADEEPVEAEQPVPDAAPAVSEYAATYVAIPPREMPPPEEETPQVERILFFYSDHTFREYRPTR